MNSPQERGLEKDLKVFDGMVRENRLQMFDGLQERISLRTGRRLLPAAQETTHGVQPAAEPPEKGIKSLQGKRQRTRASSNGSASQQRREELPQQRSGQRVAWQNAGQKNRKRLSATAPLTAIGAEHALAPGPPAIDPGAIVAVKEAVPV